MLFQISMFFFLFVLVILFHISPKVFRKWVLLAASLVFIRWQGRISGTLVILFITFMTWLMGLAVGKLMDKDNKKAAGIFGGLTIAGLAGILFGWKYLSAAASLAGLELPERIVEIGIPIGLSFYTFQAISYMADLIMGKIGSVKNPFSFTLYMTWFPKWMSGPIERTDKFLEQIDDCGNTKLIDRERLVRSVSYIIWGLFMKLVIADRIAVVVDTVYADTSIYGWGVLLLISVLYTIQIYCDFAGYTNTMIGISTLFGIELTQNFRLPYLAENIVEFWRLWHISLSSFLKDYVYIPLGGNRKGQLRKAINTLTVFFVCGMWHGVGLSFIVWGLLHGFFNVIANSLKKTKAEFLIKGNLGRLITFCLVSFAWIFFRASNLGEALRFIKGMIPFSTGLGFGEGMVQVESSLLGISVMEWWIAIIAILVLIIMDVYAHKKNTLPPEAITFNWGLVGRTVFITLLSIVILIFGRYGAGEEIRSFVYMQF